jgi:hypothetical protein
MEHRGPITRWAGEVYSLYPRAGTAQTGASTLLRYSSMGSAVDPAAVHLRLHMLQQSQIAAIGADIDDSMTATQGID